MIYFVYFTIVSDNFLQTQRSIILYFKEVLEMIIQRKANYVSTEFFLKKNQIDD